MQLIIYHLVIILINLNLVLSNTGGEAELHILFNFLTLKMLLLKIL